MSQTKPPPEYLSQSPTSPGLQPRAERRPAVDPATQAPQKSPQTPQAHGQVVGDEPNAGIGDILAPDDSAPSS